MKYLQFKMEGVDDQGIFTGHASVFNVVDLDGDVVEPGAFAEMLVNRSYWPPAPHPPGCSFSGSMRTERSPLAGPWSCGRTASACM